MIEDLITNKEKVEDLLSKYPATRDSDKLLWLAYLVVYRDLRFKIGPEAYLKFKNILLSPETSSMESIRRVRQKLQEDGLYIGTKRKDKIAESGLVKEWALNKEL